MKEDQLFNFILRQDAEFEQTAKHIIDGISALFMHLGYGINKQFKSNIADVILKGPVEAIQYFRGQATEMSRHYAIVLKELRQRSVNYDIRQAKKELQGTTFFAGRLNDYVNRAAEELGIRRPAKDEKPTSALVYYGIGLTRAPKDLVRIAMDATKILVMVEPVYTNDAEKHAMLFFNWFDILLRGDKTDDVCFNIMDDKTIKGYIGAKNLRYERDLGKNALMPVNRKMYVVEKGCIVPYQGIQHKA